MKDVKKTNYNELVKKIQKEYTYEIDTHYILIHSSIEYFIKKEMNNGNT